MCIVPKRLAILGMIGVVALAVVATGQGPVTAASSEPVKLTLLVPELTNPYWAAAVNGAKAAAQKENVHLTIGGTPGFTVDQYNAALQNAITAGNKGILIAPGDPTAFNDIIASAVAKGVVIATVIVDAPASKRRFFMGPNATLLGTQQGKLALNVLNSSGAQGEIQAAITSCSPNAISQVQIRNAFTDTVQHKNQFSSKFTVKVVTFQDATADPTKNLATFQNLALAYPKLRVVLPMCGIDSVSAGKVAADKHTNWLVFATSWLGDVLDAIEGGATTSAFNEEPYETLNAAVTAVARGIRGQEPMPTGVHNVPPTFAVKDPSSFHFSDVGAMFVNVATARQSPDSTH